jgi:hypothetical protein
MYTYYIELNSDEHMLFLKEIAQLYRLYSNVSNTPHSKLVKAIMEEYLIIQKKPKPPNIFWGYPLKQVWPASHYHPAMKWFLKKVRGKVSSYTFSNGKTYNFSIRECQDLDDILNVVIGE